MLQALHRILLVLIAIAMIGGTTSKLARSAEYNAAVVETPCNVMMSAQASDDRAMPMPPCKTMTVDCLKNFDCVTDIALRARLAAFEVLAHPTSVDYWSAWSDLAGLVRVPEPIPPRMA